MTKAKKIKVMHKTPLWAKAITPDLFKGLNIHSDGSELITRNRPAPNGSSHELKQKLDRETLRKAEHDMERSLLKEISRAIDNQNQQTYNEIGHPPSLSLKPSYKVAPLSHTIFRQVGVRLECRTSGQSNVESTFEKLLKMVRKEMVNLLEAKRLLDKKLEKLTNIIHPSLSESMHKLRNHMSAVEGPTQVSIQNGWTSIFPCYGIAVNRVTGIHRDQRGIRGGLDIIGVLGSFTEGAIWIFRI
ncbi:hypothetical protein RhiXN_09488 [Rhizoctonia solani]|uniref:Uncharacterized protein n=1 Tax=Rhizoctonia solani TaxID=456999 RepID=A0A8H8NXF7_9AGAM|nr:uncharacterized protein RhiXN_09488 [Rhizoctonia solani]QRW21901.1 hypothetical protein RhiXN_09488 [Rhizoctonia solani]